MASLAFKQCPLRMFEVFLLMFVMFGLGYFAHDVGGLDGTFTFSTVSFKSSKPGLTGGKHKLRFNWKSLPPQSEVAKRFRDLQSNCSLPVETYAWRRKGPGLGSEIHVWSNQLWGGMLESHRVKAPDPWVFTDTEVCGLNASWLCYFPAVETTCPGEIVRPQLKPVGSRGYGGRTEYTVSQIRAGATEFLFSSVSQIVIQEAERQLQAVFGDNGVPPNLITVHMRWGDKKSEAARTNVSDFITAVETMVKERISTPDSVHILLCTEDPIAVKEFRFAAHPSWKIYIDQFYTEFYPFRVNRTVRMDLPTHITVELNGKPGLWAVGSLLVAMEANYFVLTTTSNWSRLINELRMNTVNPRCGNCTHMIDLQRGEW
ncbi:hypothetical protein MHU86_14782 [Fragilaria crotonensis]|nr:hypothetical protein MHU86_14782 [Fragilaria crotonensis]